MRTRCCRGCPAAAPVDSSSHPSPPARQRRGNAGRRLPRRPGDTLRCMPRGSADRRCLRRTAPPEAVRCWQARSPRLSATGASRSRAALGHKRAGRRTREARLRQVREARSTSCSWPDCRRADSRQWLAAGAGNVPPGRLEVKYDGGCGGLWRGLWGLCPARSAAGSLRRRRLENEPPARASARVPEGRRTAPACRRCGRTPRLDRDGSGRRESRR